MRVPSFSTDLPELPLPPSPQVIKMYGWEHAFAERNAEARGKEMSVIRRTNNYRAFNFGYFLVSMPIALLAILVTTDNKQSRS